MQGWLVGIVFHFRREQIWANRVKHSNGLKESSENPEVLYGTLL